MQLDQPVGRGGDGIRIISVEGNAKVRGQRRSFCNVFVDVVLNGVDTLSMASQTNKLIASEFDLALKHIHCLRLEFLQQTSVCKPLPP